VAPTEPTEGVTLLMRGRLMSVHSLLGAGLHGCCCGCGRERKYDGEVARRDKSPLGIGKMHLVLVNSPMGCPCSPETVARLWPKETPLGGGTVSPRARMGWDGMSCNVMEKQDKLCCWRWGGVLAAHLRRRCRLRCRRGQQSGCEGKCESPHGWGSTRAASRCCCAAQEWALPVACVCVLGRCHNGCACGDSRKAMCACACAVAELLCACVGVGLVAVKLGWVMANS
jgi:hypothetical protein